MRRTVGLLVAVAAVGGGFLSPRVAFAAPITLTYEQVQDFGPYQNLGFHQAPTMMVGRDGNIWGSAGEKVFRIDSAGTLSIVYTATGPVSRLVVGDDGFLYGFTWQMIYSDGAPGADHGEFFRLDYQGNHTQVLALPKNIATDLVVGSDGAFYGGLGFECYEETCNLYANMIRITSAGAYTLEGNDAGRRIPQVVGSDGAVYGLGSQPAGIFRLDTAGSITTIHPMTEAEGFLSNLLLGSDGMIYGTGDSGYGNVIRMDNMGTVGLLHPFAVAEGAYPAGALAVGCDGAVYGVTEYGGPFNAGSVYRVDPDGTFTTVHSFNWTNGGNPNQGLLLARDGALYGVTQSGVAFRVDMSGTVSYPVLPSQQWPITPLIQGSDCGLYGGLNYYDQATAQVNAAVYRIFEPGHLCQVIDFAALPDRALGDPPFTVSATASSGLPVSWSASGSCSVAGDQVSLSDVGLCTLTASQIGDERFGPADDVSQLFTVPEPERVASLWAGCLLLGGLAKRRAARTRGLASN